MHHVEDLCKRTDYWYVSQPSAIHTRKAMKMNHGRNMINDIKRETQIYNKFKSTSITQKHSHTFRSHLNQFKKLFTKFITN